MAPEGEGGEGDAMSLWNNIVRDELGPQLEQNYTVGAVLGAAAALGAGGTLPPAASRAAAPTAQQLLCLPAAGKGAFGVVRLVQDKKTGELLACKSISKAKMITKVLHAEIGGDVGAAQGLGSELRRGCSAIRHMAAAPAQHTASPPSQALPTLNVAEVVALTLAMRCWVQEDTDDVRREVGLGQLGATHPRGALLS